MSTEHDVSGMPTKMLAEIRVRTEWEHLWATSVELYDLAAEERLKRGLASPATAGYFRTMADLIYTSRTGGDVRNLRTCIRELDQSLHVSSLLREASESVYVPDDEVPIKLVPGYCLLTLQEDVQTLNIRTYPEMEASDATAEYERLEKEAAEGEIYLLARASSLSDLRMVYPNYFSNMDKLIDWLSKQVG